MNKLGIFGDSFADPNPEELWDREKNVLPWPLWLAEFMNKELLVKARSCSPIWYAFEQFKTYFHECDTIVFVYTNHTRINGLSEQYSGLSNINYGWEKYVKDEDFDVAKILFESRKYLYNEDLQLFIYQKVFEEVNKMCYNANKKLVNLMPFEGNNNCLTHGRERHPFIVDLSTSKFPCLMSLLDVAGEETTRNPRIASMVLDTRHCHLLPYNNKVLAGIVQETFDKPNDFIYDLFTDSRFIYDAD